MGAIARKTQLLFGGSLTPSGNIGVWGSLLAGTVAYSSDPAVIQAATAWANGFTGAVVGNRSPAQQDLAGLMYVLTYQLQYILQSGMPEYDSTTNTPYWKYNMCRVNGTIYVCTPASGTGPITSDPSVDTNNWTPLADTLTAPGISKAWVTFDGINTTGGNANILDSFGVDHVVKSGTGSYKVVFSSPSPFSNNDYTMSGSAGTQNGNTSGAGDNNIICGGGVVGTVVQRDSTACDVFCWEANNGGVGQLEDSGYISVIFLGH